MPSAPKNTSPSKKTSSSSSKKTLSPEEQALLFKTRREAIEKRLERLHAKMEKDQALLIKYSIIPSSGEEEQESTGEEEITTIMQGEETQQ
jgi:hypothetical protein